MRHPLIAWNIRDLEERMKTDSEGHRFSAEVGDGRLHFEDAFAQEVGHQVFVGKRPLRHQIGILPKLQPAGYMSRLRIRCELCHLPKWRRGEQAMHGPLASNVAQAHIELVSFPVRVEGLLVQQIRPWREEWNSAQSRWFRRNGD